MIFGFYTRLVLLQESSKRTTRSAPEPEKTGGTFSVPAQSNQICGCYKQVPMW
ncbi:hypothetical protein CFAEC_13805 (plasmid) [Corynebacterium faecale]|nr:hypothetical protein CFAEC_13805 [Corynebacterium faecale]